MSNPNSPSSDPAAPPSKGGETGVPASAEGELGGHESGLDPTRYGDWEKNGRCIDF